LKLGSENSEFAKYYYKTQKYNIRRIMAKKTEFKFLIMEMGLMMKRVYCKF